MGGRQAGQLEDAQLVHAALAAVFEAIPAPAYVISERGTIRSSNAAGAVLHHELGERLADALVASLHGEAEFVLTPIVASGFPRYYLAVSRGAAGLAGARLASARVRWALTPRQAHVLERVARGATNREIAAELEMSSSTVELHVAALLDRVGASNRSEVIAKFWTET